MGSVFGLRLQPSALGDEGVFGEETQGCDAVLLLQCFVKGRDDPHHFRGVGRLAPSLCSLRVRRGGGDDVGEEEKPHDGGQPDEDGSIRLGQGELHFGK